MEKSVHTKKEERERAKELGARQPPCGRTPAGRRHMPRACVATAGVAGIALLVGVCTPLSVAWAATTTVTTLGVVGGDTGGLGITEIALIVMFVIVLVSSGIVGVRRIMGC